MTFDEIDAVCPGWSEGFQRNFFSSILQDRAIKTVLILGVLQGRDMAYCLSLREDLFVTGVDLFEEQPGADWEVDGIVSSLEQTQANLETLGFAGRFALEVGEAEAWCRQAQGRSFDLVYLDTVHDEETTRRHIQVALPLANRVLAGDDFPSAGKPGWGVDRAVSQTFPTYQTNGWCWWVIKGVDDAFQVCQTTEIPGDPQAQSL